MLNKKVINLCGFSRGGTNIVWNLLQSHPQVCSPIVETGELFRKSLFLRICRILKSQSSQGCRAIDAQLYKAKLLTIDHPDNKYISEGHLYTVQQVEDSVLNLKSVNKDIFLTHQLLKIYPDMIFIALARNGYALCEGHIRRGGTALEAGRLYKNIANEMKRYDGIIPKFKMIRFEDVLKKPFEMAEELYKFIGLEPCKLEKLRFKSKRILNSDGEHNVKYGDENRKYWFDRNTISQLFYQSVDQTQMDRLSDKSIRDFTREAESALEYFGYEKY